MNQLFDFFNFITNSEEVVRNGGLFVICLIVFAETGLFFAFFLPGDYLVFLAGVFCGTKILQVPVALLLGSMISAAIIGSLTGYITGMFFGEKLQSRKDSFFFKKKHIDTTHKYFDKYGARTLIISRFLPIIRTFAPILAGLSKMNFGSFLLYNIIGALVWIGLLTGGGFWLGERFPEIIDYIQYIILFFLSITTFTVIQGYLKTRNMKN